MEATKYGKYIVREPLGKARHPEIEVPVIHLNQADMGGAVESWEGVPFAITMEAVYQPLSMGGNGHKHDQAEILCFLGGNPMDYYDFGAEVYILLGEEKEKHIINSTSFIYIPPGLLHCPLVFTRVDKPIVFSDILLAPEYKVAEPPPK
jgi:hypothetical protein